MMTEQLIGGKVMYHIVVNTGKIPEQELKKSVVIPLDGLTEERNIASTTHEVLANAEPDTTLYIATNNTVAIYTIRAYTTKLSDYVTVEYRHYTGTTHKTIRQGEHGDLIGDVNGFFDTIDKLMLEMLGLD